MSTTAISSIRPVPERHGLRNAVVAFLVAAALGLGVAGGFALDSDSAGSSSVARSTPTVSQNTATADSIDRAPRPGSGSNTASADSLEHRVQSGSSVSTDNGCLLPGSRVPC